MVKLILKNNLALLTICSYCAYLKVELFSFYKILTKSLRKIQSFSLIKMQENVQKLYHLPDFTKIALRSFSNLPSEAALYSQKLWAEELELSFFHKNSYFFIIDFQTMFYVHVSKGVFHILGYKPEPFYKYGLDYAFQCIRPEILDPLKKIHEKLFGYFFQTPVEERLKLKFSFNLHVNHADGRILNILQQTIFTQITINGDPLTDFSTVTDITGFQKENALKLTIHKLNEEQIFEEVYQYEVPVFIRYSLDGWTKRELELLNLLSQKLSSKEIAEKLFISPNTVDTHRRNMLRKANCKNTTELLFWAKENGVL